MNRAALLSHSTILVIVTVLAGCDNVDWGGADVTVVPPPPGETEVEETVAETAANRLPEGPVLYYVAVRDSAASILPVGEIAGDTLRRIEPGPGVDAYARRFIEEHLRTGTEFALFRRGERVGTIAVRSAGMPDADACPALPRAAGVPELVPGAGGMTEFLALPKPNAPDTPRRPFDDDAVGQRMRFVAPILAERALRARGAPLPGNWQRALAQAVSFPAPDTSERAFTATLLVDDTLGPGLDAEGYSLFLVGEPAPSGYDTAYVRFADYATEGRAAPRVIDFLDWNRDGAPELLLRVYGTQAEWFEALGRRNGEWRVLLRGECAGRRSPPPAPDDTAPPAADPTAVGVGRDAPPRTSRDRLRGATVGSAPR